MSSYRSLIASSRSMLAALVVVLAAGLVFGARYWMRPPTKPAADVGRRVVEEFLSLLRSGRAGEAWDHTTAEFKSIEGRESFMRSAAKTPALKQELHFASMQEVQVQNEQRAEYIFQTAENKMVRVLVGYENGRWKVDRLTL